MQPITEKFVRFIGQIVVRCLSGEVKAFSGLVEEVDLQTDTILLRFKDGRHSLVKASRVDFVSEARKV